MSPLLPQDGLPDFSPEARRRRLVGGFLLATILVLSAWALQGSFDAGDRGRALAALDSPAAGNPEGARLRETLRGRGGGAPPRCTAEVLSAARGVTRVACTVEGDPAPYLFLWDDLRRDGLRPDDAARRRLAGP